MGKRARKTRWRALDIADEHSDSEESNTNSSAVSSRNSRSYSNGYYSKYSYSSQSTPARRRYNQYDGSAKSTRSSSTTSENKITFNEDEYTRITTPRQDVLFKKGYLNKPKTYQTQTSTGNSTISTGNSTENGTPDHQSTDLDYESQFMFPNGFVDQNGIYYVNSYEPYPLMLFNPPTYYHEYSNIKSKRMSTGSLSESLSPTNEEATSQDLSPSGGDASNSVSDYSVGPPVMVFPGYYVNGGCTPTDLASGHHQSQDPVKKLKKRRERKTSKNIQEDSSEYTDENSCEETPESSPHHKASVETASEQPTDTVSRLDVPTPDMSHKDQVCPDEKSSTTDTKEESKTVSEITDPTDNSLSNGCADIKTELNDKKSDNDQAQPTSDCPKPSVLKPDAEEFVPRSYINLGPPPHIKMLPNYMPIPLVQFSDFAGQNFAPHPAFIPSGIPINLIPHHPGQKMYPPAPGFVNLAPPTMPETKIEENPDKNEEETSEDKDNQSMATPAQTPVVEESKPSVHGKNIDMATVMSKLEAVKQQENHENDTRKDASAAVVNETKPFIGSPRFRKPPIYKRNYYTKHKGLPISNGEPPLQIENGDSSTQVKSRICNSNSAYSVADSPQKQINGDSSNQRNSPAHLVDVPVPTQNGQADPLKNETSARNSVASILVQNKDHVSPISNRNSPIHQSERSLPLQQKGQIAEKNVAYGVKHSPVTNSTPLSKDVDARYSRNSPERLKKNWKFTGSHNNQNSYASSRRVNTLQNAHSKSLTNGFDTTCTRGEFSPKLNKNNSETIKRAQIISATLSPQSKKHINIEKPVKTDENVADMSVKSELPKPKTNQWISVSSRKRKKNKNTEEVDLDTDQDVFNESILSVDVSSDFEAYDVTQLVDVIPPTQEQNSEQQKNIEDILTIIAQNEPSEILANGQQTPNDIVIPEVSAIEKDIIVKIEEQKEVLVELSSEEVLTSNLQNTEQRDEVDITKEPKIQLEDNPEEEAFKSKKKSKKGTQKPLTKKVMITDIDLRMEATEIKTPVKKSVTKVGEASVKSQPKTPIVVSPDETSVVKESAPEVPAAQTEKKPKKKKKNKTPKRVQNEMSSGLNTTSNNADSSYELLLQNSLVSENLEKTNDDISLELEKLIQKGMYSSLQEKIKSINVEPEADGFFKNFQAAPSTGKEKPATANGFMRTPDFNRIFQSTRQFLKPNMVSVEQDNSDYKVEVDDISIKDIKTSYSAPDAADSDTGPFIENSEAVQEVLGIQEATSEVTIDSKTPSNEDKDEEDNKKLYPITQAVKEWMSKTREATPEVEILKSPSTIQKEFGDNGSPDNDLNDPLDSDEDDEVTLFSTDDNLSLEQHDLFDYWEDDVGNPQYVSDDCGAKKEAASSESPKICSDGASCAKCQNNSIKEGNDEIEVYESKYGQNDAFLNLQKELKEKQTNASYPKNLRNRTVCCSLQ